MELEAVNVANAWSYHGYQCVFLLLGTKRVRYGLWDGCKECVSSNQPVNTKSKHSSHSDPAVSCVWSYIHRKSVSGNLAIFSLVFFFLAARKRDGIVNIRADHLQYYRQIICWSCIYKYKCCHFGWYYHVHAGPPLGSELIMSLLRRDQYQRPQHLWWWDDAKSASATDCSFVSWVLRQQNLVRVRRIEYLLMFFRSSALTKIVEIPRLEHSYRDSIASA